MRLLRKDALSMKLSWKPELSINICRERLYELHQAKRGLMVIFKNFVRYISAFDNYKGLYWFCANTFENKILQYLQNRLSRMLDISNCDVIYYVIYVICSHYVRKAISPLFTWPSSYVINVAFGYEKNNPARRAGEKNNLAPILSEKKFSARTKIPSPPPLNIKWTVPYKKLNILTAMILRPCLIVLLATGF